MSTTLPSLQELTAAGPFVRQTRLIRATRKAVYEAWTLPEIFAKWWGPAEHVVSEVRLDVREGGTIYFKDDALPHAFVPPGFPRSMTASGVYTEVVPGERLQFTLQASWNTTGEPSLITVSFRDADGGTEITIVQQKIAAEHVHLYEAGWTSVLDKFVALFAA